MIVSIHQPLFLPWLGFFHKMTLCDTFVFLDTVQFEKDYFDNRNRIKGRRGAEWLTVPVFKKHRSRQLFSTVEIDNSRNWRRRHYALIEQAYRNAPYFEMHKAELQEIYKQEWRYLLDINLTIIAWLKAKFEIATPTIQASSLHISARGGTWINLAICQALGATTYISGPAGKNYLDESAFSERSIRVDYHKFRHPVYRQCWGDFIPGMSALDLLCNYGPVAAAILREPSRASGTLNNEKSAIQP